MTSPMPSEVIPIEQHDIEIQRNAAAWRSKPLLRLLYGVFYGRVGAHLAPTAVGPRLEIGSGMGAIKEFVPDCITSDLFPNPWLDRVENAYVLTCDDASLGSLILFDVWHHLEYPGTALAEFHRTLRPGGRLILFEPAASPLGRLVYGLFHHEPVNAPRPLRWLAPTGFNPRDHPYYAAQGNCWRMFARGKLPVEVRGWTLKHVGLNAALPYVASGGFSRWQLYPTFCYPLVVWIDRLLDLAPRLFATRMLVVLEKDATPPPPA